MTVRSVRAMALAVLLAFVASPAAAQQPVNLAMGALGSGTAWYV